MSFPFLANVLMVVVILVPLLLAVLIWTIVCKVRCEMPTRFPPYKMLNAGGWNNFSATQNKHNINGEDDGKVDWSETWRRVSSVTG
jgi:hypothetical protein